MEEEEYVTSDQAARYAGVRSHVMRTIVRLKLVPSKCRQLRSNELQASSNRVGLRNMIAMSDLQALMADEVRWRDACETAYTRVPAAARAAVAEAQQREGDLRRRVEDAIEAKRIGVPVDEWAL